MWNEFEGRKRYDVISFKERSAEKQILDEFLRHCEKKQIEAIQRMIHCYFAFGLKKHDWPGGSL